MTRAHGVRPEDRLHPHTVGADEGDLLALLEVEVYVLKDERAAPELPEVTGSEDWWHVPEGLIHCPDEASQGMAEAYGAL